VEFEKSSGSTEAWTKLKFGPWKEGASAKKMGYCSAEKVRNDSKVAQHQESQDAYWILGPKNFSLSLLKKICRFNKK